ncbi:spore germination protein [Bacillus sp. 2205SS5-2]|uniref:spore germination protein n=1 Tax=Bacillus sp. 2205SS5-2 TaxID=3109031 RepID=UPI0030053182
MFFRNKAKPNPKPTKPHSTKIEECKKQLEEVLNNSSDLVIKMMIIGNKKLILAYIGEMINSSTLNMVIQHLNEIKIEDLNYKQLQYSLPVGTVMTTNQLPFIGNNIIKGSVYIYVEGDATGILASIGEKAARSVEKSETESIVFGPKVSFTEDISSNLSLIRGRIDDPKLKVEEIIVGSRVKTSVQIVYISDIAETENVNSFKQRLWDLEVDSVIDSAVLSQQIEDNSYSIFPQLTVTELPDRFTISLIQGKVGLLVDKSPTAIIGPATFFTFFESTEDLYLRWNMGTFLRMLRFTSIFLSVLLTPAYVAVLTYHYEVIPSALLTSLGQSRANVPFPPVFEAILLEFVIELLREAGARLPTKVGQTMGIVGGIVIGQAAVQAGFTSNILIIIIALSALGSFTSPSYLMGTAVRLIRFPLIILAGLWGGIGIMFAFCIIIIHLLRLTTLGRPYLSPVYPPRFSDWKYSLFRVPLQFLAKRPQTNRPIDDFRMPKKKAKIKKDIDE